MTDVRNILYRKSQSDDPEVAFRALVRLDKALPVVPTIDSGYKSYGAGRLFLPAATNLCKHPSFEIDTDVDGMSDGWYIGSATVTGTVVTTRIPGRTGGYAQRAQYTGVAGDAAGNKVFRIQRDTGDVGEVAPGDVVTISVYAKGAVSGMTINAYIESWTAAGGWIATDAGPVAVTLNAGYTRYSFTSPALGATSSRLTFMLLISSIGTGDTIDITIDDVLIEKSSVLTPYFDGSYPDCAWTGTAHASTSTRAASALTVPIGGSFGTTGVGTVALRAAAIYASSGGVPQYAPLAGMYKASGAVTNRKFVYSRTDLETAVIEGYDGTHNPAASVSDAFAVGSPRTIIGRFSGTKLDIMVNGTAGAQADDTLTVSGIDTLSLGAFAAFAGAWATSAFANATYIGPLAISPSRITDAQTVIVDAGLTAGWTGLDLFRAFRDWGYVNTLILPLGSDSTGYVVR